LVIAAGQEARLWYSMALDRTGHARILVPAGENREAAQAA
jgi:hypothetical protein